MTLKQFVKPAIFGALFFFSNHGFADGGLYVGAGIGSATLNGNEPLTLIEDEADTWRAMVGLGLGEHLSVDVGYHDFGRLAAVDVFGFPSGRSNLSVNGWTFSGTLLVPLSQSMSLFGRGGVFIWDAAIDATGFRSSFADDSDPFFGAGAKVSLNRNFTLVGDWSRFEFQDVDADVYTLGFEYRFGL